MKEAKRKEIRSKGKGKNQKGCQKGKGKLMNEE